VKIDRSKLNTLLRSGLNSEIKTRKQLAAHLGLDPTSLTRWFANRDRLGNPRYPVVPDRHVTKILALFNLTAQCLHLNDDEFRQHCFELSLLRTKEDIKGQDDLAKKNQLRLEHAEKRKLLLQDYTETKTNKVPIFVSLLALTTAGGWFAIEKKVIDFWQPLSISNESSFNETKCWTGYSPSLGNFKRQDKADPCNYGKLFHSALMQLKLINESQQTSKMSSEFTALEDYILFLSEKLDQRRIDDRITINIELGKSELRRLNYQKAQGYFQIASDILGTLSNPKPAISAELIALSTKAKAALN